MNINSRVKIACTALSACLVLFLIAGIPVVHGNSNDENDARPKTLLYSIKWEACS